MNPRQMRRIHEMAEHGAVAALTGNEEAARTLRDQLDGWWEAFLFHDALDDESRQMARRGRQWIASALCYAEGGELILNKHDLNLLWGDQP